MVRNLKGLALALIAVLAMSALAAAGAQAAPELKAGEYPATLEGSQSNIHVFTASGRKVTCEVANFKGTLAGQSETVTITPTYEKCHSEILGNKFPAKVTMGCAYEFHATTTLNATERTAHVDIDCAAGKNIQVHIYENATKEKEDKSMCTITIGAQEKRTTATIVNNAGVPETINVNANVSGISFTVSPEGLLCGTSGAGATYVGNTGPVKAFNGGGTQINVTGVG